MNSHNTYKKVAKRYAKIRHHIYRLSVEEIKDHVSVIPIQLFLGGAFFLFLIKYYLIGD